MDTLTKMDGKFKKGLDHTDCDILPYNQLANRKWELAHRLKKKTTWIVGGESCRIKKIRHCFMVSENMRKKIQFNSISPVIKKEKEWILVTSSLSSFFMKNS